MCLSFTSNTFYTSYRSDPNHLFITVNSESSNLILTSSDCSWTWLERSRPFQSKVSISTPSIIITEAVAIIKTLLEHLQQGTCFQFQEVRNLNFELFDFQFPVQKRLGHFVSSLSLSNNP